MTKRKDVIKALKAMQEHMLSIAGASGSISHITAQHYFGVITDTLDLLKESEKCKTWGGFIDIDWASDEEAVGHQAVFNKLIELGLLKVARTQGIEYTRYNWAIKAVKWDE